MKLYARATNTKGKTEGVGDNVQIDTSFIKGNKVEYTAHYTTEGLMVYQRGVIVLDTITKGKSQKGEPREGLCHCGYPCIYGTDYCDRHQTP